MVNDPHQNSQDQGRPFSASALERNERIIDTVRAYASSLLPSHPTSLVLRDIIQMVDNYSGEQSHFMEQQPDTPAIRDILNVRAKETIGMLREAAYFSPGSTEILGILSEATDAQRRVSTADASSDHEQSSIVMRDGGRENSQSSKADHQAFGAEPDYWKSLATPKSETLTTPQIVSVMKM